MRSFADAGSSGVVKQLTDNSQVTKVTGATFPTEDVIQDRPVSNVVQAEHQPPPFYTQPNVADLQSGASTDKPVLVEGPSAKSGDERSPPFLLELFCGTAGVCAQFKTRGGRALDHHLKRTRLKAAAVKLDLTQPWVQELIEREVKLGRVHAIHLGPPCGTASRARNIPVKRKLRSKGAPNPQPLRSSVTGVSVAEGTEQNEGGCCKLSLRIFCSFGSTSGSVWRFVYS